jgi:hypothetical protein
MADGSHTSAEIMARASSQGQWVVPVEIALALPTSSLVRDVVARRAARDGSVQPKATIFARGDRYFAIVKFGGSDDWLLFPIDVWLRP